MDANNVTLLLGAGASAATGVPTAYSLIDEVVDNLVTRSWAASEIKRLKMTDREDLRDECDFIRFETLLYWVEDNYRNVDFLEFLEAYSEPSGLQQSIVDFALNGATILTPNFDDLLERAYIKAGISPTTIDAHHVPNTKMPLGAGYVIKLHHSWFYHSSGSFTRGAQPISATMDVIIRESPGGKMNEKASEVLKHSVNGRELITIGYSASDAIDIVPALFECLPSEVHWVNYSDSTCVAYDWPKYVATRPDSPLTAWERLVQRWHDGGAGIYVYCGRAEDALGHIGIKYSPSATNRDDDSWRKAVNKWSKSVRRHDPTGLGLAGHLFGELCLYDIAGKAMRESIGYRDGNCGWSSAKRLYEIAQNEYLRGNADFFEILKLARKAQRNARMISDKRTLEFALILEGRCYFCLEDWEKALEIFQSREFKRSGYAYKGYCKSWIGRTLLWSNHTQRSIRFLIEACEYLQQNGDIDNLVDAEFALGVAHKRLGKLTEAKKLLITNDNECRLQGLLMQRSYTLTELGNVDLLFGNIDSARNSIEQALTLLIDNGNDEISDAFSALIDVEILAGHYAEAIVSANDSVNYSTVMTDSGISEYLAKKAACEFLLKNNKSCDDTLALIRNLPETKCSYMGLLITSVVEYCRDKISKTHLNDSIKLSKVATHQRILLAVLCSRLGITSSKVRKLKDSAWDTLHKEHISSWDSEMSRL